MSLTVQQHCNEACHRAFAGKFPPHHVDFAVDWLTNLFTSNPRITRNDVSTEMLKTVHGFGPVTLTLLDAVYDVVRDAFEVYHTPAPSESDKVPTPVKSPEPVKMSEPVKLPELKKINEAKNETSPPVTK